MIGRLLEFDLQRPAIADQASQASAKGEMYRHGVALI
jgi:hypothetical protein